VQVSGIWGSAHAWLWRKRLVVACACVAVVASLAYIQSRRFGFIYDDYWTVVGNEHLDKPLRELLTGAWSGRSIEWKMPDATRPLMGLSLWLDRRAFGVSPAGYHVHSVLLYALGCVLAFLLAFGLLRRLVPALGGALVYAAAPLHVEVATAINYREDLLAAIGLFGAAALLFWPAREAWRWRNLACAALWAYALLGKESALIGPAFIAALAILRRPNLATRSDDVLPLGLACGGVVILWLNWRFGLSRIDEQIPTAAFASWTDRLLRTCRFEVISVFKSVVPIAPRPEYGRLAEAHWLWVPAALALIAGVVVLARRRAARPVAAAGAVALVAPLFTSPLLAPLNELADRYWFVSSFAVALLVGFVMVRLEPRRSWLAVAILVVGGVVAGSKASRMWSSEVDLWTFAAQTAPQSARAWSALSRVHRLADQEELADRALDRAIELAPERLSAQATRVLNALWFGRLELARQRLASIGQDTLVSDSLRVARRCALAGTAEAARACARRSLPTGMVLGDTERLRRVSEQLLGVSPSLSEVAVEPKERDAGADAETKPLP
jgi:uncharacterized membrane protein